MKNFLLFFLSCLSINCLAQIHFEQGYLIDGTNQRVECLIKNKDWQKNPTEIIYKLSFNSEPITASVKTIKEFGIDGKSKYVRADVMIDISSNSKNVKLLSKEKAPNYVRRRLFLKVLVEGEANLYEFKDKFLKKYFYNMKGDLIEQLVYKLYLTKEDKVAENKNYRQQLWNSLKCEGIKNKEIERVDYKIKELVKIFAKYNACVNSDIKNFAAIPKGDLFNLSAKFGINKSNLTIFNTRFDFDDIVFDNHLNYRYGLETEFILPFNRNKWSLFIEPTIQSYKSTSNIPNQTVSVDYKSFELPFGLRHFFFLNDQTKIFVNAAYTFDFEYQSSVVFSSSSNLNVKTRPNWSVGVGLKVFDKFSLELEYYLRRELLGEQILWRSDYSTVSLVLGYTIF